MLSVFVKIGVCSSRSGRVSRHEVMLGMRDGDCGAEGSEGFEGLEISSACAATVGKANSRRGAQSHKAEVAAQVVPDGRICRLCAERDDGADPVMRSCSRRWGYVTKDSPPKNQGGHCYYCLRVFTARYQLAHKSLKAFLTHIGSDPGRRQEFLGHVETCIEQMKANGKWDCHIAWQPEQELSHTASDQQIWEEPDDLYYELSEYTKSFGDPHTNGLNHTVTERQNRRGVWETCVIVPQPKVYRLKRRRVESADLRRVIDHSSNAIGAGQLEANWSALAANIGEALPQATGATLDSLLSLAPKAAAVTGPQLVETGAPPAPSAADEDDELLQSLSLAPAFPALSCRPVGGGRGAAIAGPRACGPSLAVTPARAPRPTAPSSRSACKRPVVGSDEGRAASSTADSPAEKAQKNSRGRPKEDANSRSSRILADFMKADESCTQWFGDRWKSQDRMLNRLVAEVKDMMRSEEDEEMFRSWEATTKKLHAILQVCRAYKSHGPSSKGLRIAFVEAQRFLQASPAADEPFPMFLRHQMHTVGAADAWPAQVFWTFLSAESLVQSGGFDASDVAERQREMLTDKVVGLCQVDAVDKLRAAVMELTSFDTSALGLAPEVTQSLQHLRWIVALPDQPLAETLARGKAALAAAPTDKVLQGLAVFPRGRLALSAAADKLKGLQRLEMEGEVLAKAFRELQVACQ